MSRLAEQIRSNVLCASVLVVVASGCGSNRDPEAVLENFRQSYAVVRGSVTTAQGEPIVRARVVVWRYARCSDYSKYSLTETDARGGFTITIGEFDNPIFDCVTVTAEPPPAYLLKDVTSRRDTLRYRLEGQKPDTLHFRLTASERVD